MVPTKRNKSIVTPVLALINLSWQLIFIGEGNEIHRENQKAMNYGKKANNTSEVKLKSNEPARYGFNSQHQFWQTGYTQDKQDELHDTYCFYMISSISSVSSP